MKVTALAGGVGASRLLRGMVRRIDPASLTVIVNTGDDDEFFGLRVSPDLDTTVYNLAGVAPRARGWGLARDSSRVLGALRRFYGETWFGLGDLDLATNLYRSDRLRRGEPLHRVSEQIARRFGVTSTVLPMSNQRVSTTVETMRGESLPFQRYFVERGARDRVRRLAYRGLRSARPAPGVLRAIARADVLVLPPSNPYTSIHPILGVRGVEAAIRARRAPMVAVSPVAGGRAVRGPLGGMLRADARPVSVLGIAEVYRGLIDGLVIDDRDRDLRTALEHRGLAVATVDIRMDSMARSVAVARTVIELAERLRET